MEGGRATGEEKQGKTERSENLGRIRPRKPHTPS